MDLKSYKKECHKIASELQYSSNVHFAIEQAKTVNEVIRAMKTERMSY